MFWSLPVAALAPGKSIDLSAWRSAGRALWPEAAPIVERAAESEITRATYRHVALPRWNEGPVLFIGDAAHGTSPQLGQGANLGLVDAHTLCRGARRKRRPRRRRSPCSAPPRARPCASIARPAIC